MAAVKGGRRELSVMSSIDGEELFELVHLIGRGRCRCMIRALAKANKAYPEKT